MSRSITYYCETCKHFERAEMKNKKSIANIDNFHFCKRHNRACYAAINRGCGKYYRHWEPNILKIKKVINYA